MVCDVITSMYCESALNCTAYLLTYLLTWFAMAVIKSSSIVATRSENAGQTSQDQWRIQT